MRRLRLLRHSRISNLQIHSGKSRRRFLRHGSGTRGSAMALVQSQQLTDKETPHKQRGFLMPARNCANFVLPLFANTTGAQDMSTPVITVFVRHSDGCKYAGDEFSRRCDCRKHFRWTQNGTQYRRKAGTRSWEEAEEIKRQLQDELAGRTPETRPEDNVRTVSEAVTSSSRTKRSKAYRLAWCPGTRVSWAASKRTATKRTSSRSHGSRGNCSQATRQRGKSIIRPATRGRPCANGSVASCGTALSADGWTASPPCPRLKRMNLPRSRSLRRSTSACWPRLIQCGPCALMQKASRGCSARKPRRGSGH